MIINSKLCVLHAADLTMHIVISWVPRLWTGRRTYHVVLLCKLSKLETVSSRTTFTVQVLVQAYYRSITVSFSVDTQNGWNPPSTESFLNLGVQRTHFSYKFANFGK